MKYLDAGNRMEVKGLGEKGPGGHCLMSTEFQFFKMKRDLK
jgi:hypothetical protein